MKRYNLMSDKFKDYGVSTIIAIDDIFNDINEEDKLEKFLPEVIDDLTGGEYDRFKDYTILEYIDESGEVDFIDKLSSTLDQIEHYRCFQSDNIDFKKIGANYSQVERAINEIDSSDKSRKHLILLDRTLQDPVAGLGDDDVFVDILKLIHSKLREKNLLLLIYTDSRTPEELSSFEGAKEYLRNLGLDESVAEQLVLHFNYFQKTEELSSDFFDNILKSQKANYISEYKNIFEESFSKLTERLWQLNQNQVLFYYDYINEGQHVDSIIYETFLTKFKQVYSDTFNEENNHKELINPIRRSMQHHIESVSQSQIKLYRQLKEFEMALNNQNNFLEIPKSSDISFGDVIRISDKYYMVMSQDCDMTIRNDGKRRLSSIQLVEISKQTEKISEQYLFNNYKKMLRKCEFVEVLNKLGISNEILHKLEESRTSESLSSEQIGNLYSNNGFEATTKKIISIEDFWLDCLTLRKNENSEFEFTSSNLEISHEIRRATLKYLQSRLEFLLNKLKNTNSDVVDKIINFTLLNSEIDVESMFVNSELIGFKLKNIERIGRLDRLDAMIILNSVLEYNSRIPKIHNLLL